MQGLFVTAPGKLEILDLPEPVVGPYDALVQILACGICNSTDWKLIEGEFLSGSYPVLIGHESVGRVIHVGNKVRSYRAGDLVLRPGLRDEHIPFSRGRSCWGGFADQGVVTDVWAQKGVVYNTFPHAQQIIPPNIGPIQAAALITLKESLSCLENSDIGEGQSLAIIGTGPVAQTLTHFARLSGIKPVIVFGRRLAWQKRFFELGADDYVTGDDFPPLAEAVMQQGGFDRAIEAVGARSALSRCLQVLKHDGRVSLYGIPPKSALYLREEESDPRVFRCKVEEADAHERLLTWVDERKIDLDYWYSHTMPWTEYERGFHMIRKKEANKVILTFTE